MSTSTAEQQGRERVQALATKLYADRRDYLLRIARANGAGDDDAPDSVNDAFAAFVEKFDPDCGAPPLAWVTTTLKRRCWAIYRSRHLDRSVGQEAGPDSDRPGFSVTDIASKAPGIEETIERAEFVLEARERLAALKPDQRAALVLHAAGFSYREIAKRRKWTYTKTNRSIAEGRATLRAGLAGKSVRDLGAKG